MLVYRMRGVEAVRWDAIDQVRIDLSSVHGIVALGIRIRQKDGRTIAISGTADDSPRPAPTPGLMPRISLPDLIGIIVEASYPHRLADVLARYEAGERVNFKTVQVSREGLHVKGHTLPWSRIADIATDGAIMLVKELEQARPWRVVRAIQIPNEDMLPALIAQTQGVHYQAFQEHGESSEVAAVQRQRHRRHKMLRWGLPLLFIGLPLAISYGYYLTTAESARWRGEKAFYRGDYIEALDAFDLALQREPDNPLYYVNRGRAEREVGLDVRALKDFATALRLQPDYPTRCSIAGACTTGRATMTRRSPTTRGRLPTASTMTRPIAAVASATSSWGQRTRRSPTSPCATTSRRTRDGANWRQRNSKSRAPSHKGCREHRSHLGALGQLRVEVRWVLNCEPG